MTLIGCDYEGCIKVSIVTLTQENCVNLEDEQQVHACADHLAVLVLLKESA